METEHCERQTWGQLRGWCKLCILVMWPSHFLACLYLFYQSTPPHEAPSPKLGVQNWEKHARYASNHGIFYAVSGSREQKKKYRACTCQTLYVQQREILTQQWKNKHKLRDATFVGVSRVACPILTNKIPLPHEFNETRHYIYQHIRRPRIFTGFDPCLLQHEGKEIVWKTTNCMKNEVSYGDPALCERQRWEGHYSITIETIRGKDFWYHPNETEEAK